jgi:hypothetical protein
VNQGIDEADFVDQHHLPDQCIGDEGPSTENISLLASFRNSVPKLRRAARAPHLERAKRRLRLKFRILEESSAGRPNASISAI